MDNPQDPNRVVAKFEGRDWTWQEVNDRLCAHCKSDRPNFAIIPCDMCPLCAYDEGYRLGKLAAEFEALENKCIRG